MIIDNPYHLGNNLRLMDVLCFVASLRLHYVLCDCLATSAS